MVSLRPNYFSFIGYLKTGGGQGGSGEPHEAPLDPPIASEAILKIEVFCFDRHSPNPHDVIEIVENDCKHKIARTFICKVYDLEPKSRWARTPY